MTRGNQREVDRARAQARAKKYAKKESNGDPQSRNANDGAALQEKVARKAAMAAAKEEEAKRAAGRKKYVKPGSAPSSSGIPAELAALGGGRGAKGRGARGRGRGRGRGGRGGGAPPAQAK